ncbi:MAG TPA: ATP-binding cassette domain-containing protein [Ktedonobacterales bacterium]|nr:ATP-binding cassette domain-containing protein [Ktedonobacterales bacterium]
MTDHTMSEREAELQALPISDKQLDTTAERIKSRNRDSIVALEGAAAQLGARTIWSQATFQVTPGEFIAILGPNGAGKSTLLRVLLGLLRPSAGRVEVLGSAPRRGHPAIGYVPQRRTLDPDLPVRGRDLVMLGLDGRHWGFALPGPKRQKQHLLVEEALAAVGATAYADRPVGQLSGGEQQRLLLAQALVGQPSLLLLDEPLASLDLRNQVAIANLVARVAREQGITVLLVTHDVNPLLPVIDRVLYVAQGQALIGFPDDIITTESLTRLYGAPVEVVHDSRGRVFVVGLEQELMSPSVE